VRETQRVTTMNSALASALAATGNQPSAGGTTASKKPSKASALFMVVTRCVSRTTLVRCVDWKVLALIVGTVPLGAAIEHTGVAALAATHVTGAAQALGAPGVLAALFLLAAALAVLTSNAAAAVVVAPVAAKAAVLAGLPVHTALLCTAFGCSCTFLLPFAQQNLLVMTPGGYSTRDFVRLGIPMSLVMLVVTVAALCLLG
jgi:di/tricarboxylate transporter